MYRILPFHNLTPDSAPIASDFAERLDLEIRRIVRLLDEDPLAEPTAFSVLLSSAAT